MDNIKTFPNTWPDGWTEIEAIKITYTYETDGSGGEVPDSDDDSSGESGGEGLQ